MANAVKDSFLDLEKHRQLLEDNIEKLRKSLQHWQIWEAEYEGLKEEIIFADPEPSHERLLAIGREFDGKLVTQAEVEDILGFKIPRSADQVTNVLSRRIDYVVHNVKTLEKQLETAENKLAAATVISNPDVRTEDGLPLTEIIEELDEDGNVISSRIETQGGVRGQLLEVLEKAGVKDLPGNEHEGKSAEISTGSDTSDGMAKKDVPGASISSDIPRKSVQFAEGTKEGPETHKSQTARRVEAIANSIKQNNSVPEETSVIPLNESPEDAALRKEMLQYGMSEVGAVVAELDLEDGSDFTDDDNDLSSIEDDEDEFGRSTKKVVGDEIRRQMIELEQRLGLRMMENVGPNPDVSVENESPSETHDTIETIKVPKIVKERKGVRFAEELDFSEDGSGAFASEPLEPEIKAPSKSPIRDVIERAPSTQKLESIPTPPQKMSRFRSARAAKPPAQPFSGFTDITSTTVQPPSTSNITPNPTMPASRPLADTIIEREIPTGTLAAEPDELDSALLQQEVTTEYHRMRNRMIQKQGGFMRDLELERGDIPLTEEEGGPKKMSRFKAARLSRS